MTNTEIIYNALNSTNFGQMKGTCCVCGKLTRVGFKAKDYIKNARFTNFDILQEPTSQVICENCATCISNADLRRKNFIADKNHIEFLQKNDVENVIFDLKNHVESEFVVCMTQSFKKHNSFKATVNIDASKFVVQLEDDKFTIDTQIHKHLYDVMNEMYLFFSKDEIATGDYNYISLKEFGLDKFNYCENEIKSYRASMVFDFLLYILNSERRNEAVKERLKAKKEAEKFVKGKKK